MKDTNLAIIESSAPIKYMAQGKVNGCHVNMRSRYMEQMEQARSRLILMTGGAFVAGCAITTLALWASMYLFA